MINKIQEFEEVRRWGAIRGISGASFDVQFQRCMQEILEIHEAYHVHKDHDKLKDAIGDSIVTLINVAMTVDENAEDCLEEAFGVIELRKGLNKNGNFIRYAKLSDEEKAICDKKQGSPGNQYFKRSMLDVLTPEHFKQ